jgi:hypothetical protein
LWGLISFNAERPSSHRYVVEKGMSISTDVTDSTGYSDFNESQKVFGGITANLVSRVLSALKATSSPWAFNGREFGSTYAEGITNPILFFAIDLEIFTELLVKGI